MKTRNFRSARERRVDALEDRVERLEANAMTGLIQGGVPINLNPSAVNSAPSLLPAFPVFDSNLMPPGNF